MMEGSQASDTNRQLIQLRLRRAKIWSEPPERYPHGRWYFANQHAPVAERGMQVDQHLFAHGAAFSLLHSGHVTTQQFVTSLLFARRRTIPPLFSVQSDDTAVRGKQVKKMHYSQPYRLEGITLCREVATLPYHRQCTLSAFTVIMTAVQTICAIGDRSSSKSTTTTVPVRTVRMSDI
jgi:hypothetical protein